MSLRNFQNSDLVILPYYRASGSIHFMKDGQLFGSGFISQLKKVNSNGCSKRLIGRIGYMLVTVVIKLRINSLNTCFSSPTRMVIVSVCSLELLPGFMILHDKKRFTEAKTRINVKKPFIKMLYFNKDREKPTKKAPKKVPLKMFCCFCYKLILLIIRRPAFDNSTLGSFYEFNDMISLGRLRNGFFYLFQSV